MPKEVENVKYYAVFPPGGDTPDLVFRELIMSADYRLERFDVSVRRWVLDMPALAPYRFLGETGVRPLPDRNAAAAALRALVRGR